MKHNEIYDKHSDHRKSGGKKKVKKNHDSDARHQRISFKNYVRELEEELLEQDFDESDDELLEQDLEADDPEQQ